MNQLSSYPHLKWYVSNLRSTPGGSYLYGASPSQKRSGSRITMSPFKMGATPVTWGMWKEYRRSVAVPGKDIKLPRDPGWGYPDDHPVVSVSWEDIMQPSGFCEWASKTAGFKLTLPSGAQYEYAARGGKDGLDYPWGNTFEYSRLWCGNANVKQTAAVDRPDRIYRNGYGLTDMVGNVDQWCSDYFNVTYRPVGKDPVDNNNGGARCCRGGDCFNYELDLGSFRCATRSFWLPEEGSHFIGFRLVAGPR